MNEVYSAYVHSVYKTLSECSPVVRSILYPTHMLLLVLGLHLHKNLSLLDLGRFVIYLSLQCYFPYHLFRISTFRHEVSYQQLHLEGEQPFEVLRLSSQTAGLSIQQPLASGTFPFKFPQLKVALNHKKNYFRNMYSNSN